jgi:streptomycin 6-kinase
VSPLELPHNLVDAARHQGREPWLATLGSTVEDLEQRWSISVDPPFQPGGSAAWVAPARNDAGDDLVLKLVWPHTEAEHESDALRLWSGHGAVVLYEVAELDHTVALLLERCQPGTTLSALDQEEQDVVVAGLLRRLWREPSPGHRFRPLATMCKQWADEFERKLADGRRVGLDAELVEKGIELFRTLPDAGEPAVVLCTDLHAGNVLAAQRERWLAIDPKPYVGDPAYDVLQHMLNCPERLRTDPFGLAAKMASLTDLDPDGVARWLFARCVQESPDWPGLADVAAKMAKGL